MALPLKQIRAVDPRRHDLDQHFVRSWAGSLNLSQFEHVRRAGFPCDDDSHVPQRAISQRTGRLGSGCSPRRERAKCAGRGRIVD